MGAQPLIMSPELSENVSSKSFGNCVRTVVKGDDELLKRWKSHDQKYEENCRKIVPNHEGLNFVLCRRKGEIIVLSLKDGIVRKWQSTI